MYITNSARHSKIEKYSQAFAETNMSVLTENIIGKSALTGLYRYVVTKKKHKSSPRAWRNSAKVLP